MPGHSDTGTNIVSPGKQSKVTTDREDAITTPISRQAAVKDIEIVQPTAEPDIEHQPVSDDPRLWSDSYKWFLVGVLSFGALIPTLAANIYFPVLNDLTSDLHASQSSIALSISLYILAQGGFPLVWAPISEIFGRKGCFLVAMALFSICSFIIGAATHSISVLIALRVIAAAGSAAMLTIAAGSLADLYEPSQRGVKVGVYYACPLIGPALGPIFGGALGETGHGSWRLTFYFLGACGAASFLSFVFIRDTFRPQRSLAWEKSKARALQRAERDDMSATGGKSACQTTFWDRIAIKGLKTSKWHLCPSQQRISAALADREITNRQSSKHPVFLPPEYTEADRGMNRSSSSASVPAASAAQGEKQDAFRAKSAPEASGPQETTMKTVTSRLTLSRTVTTTQGQKIKFRPSFGDVSPLSSAGAVLCQPHNIIALGYSGLAFASQYSLSFTATRTFTRAPYLLSPIGVGALLLALGLAGMVGSILGGRLSDRALRQGTALNKGQKADSELRILSVRLPMLLCPPSFVGYAWSAYYRVHIAVPIICLILLGFSLFWIYSSTLSYIIDSNVGRSSGAVACNSALRGLFAFIASEVAGPLQDSIGDGALYTGWAVLLALGQIGLLVVGYKGKQWRDPMWNWSRLACYHRRTQKRMPEDDEFHTEEQ